MFGISNATTSLKNAPLQPPKLSKKMKGEFLMVFIYAEERDSMWRRLTSKLFCERIMPVFGVKSIGELKERISKCVYDREYHYFGTWPGAARAILTWIKLEDVATLP